MKMEPQKTNGTALPKPSATGATSRMTLGNISSKPSRGTNALRVLLYAPEGLGKTTFAAGAPSPVFLGPEDGYGVLEVPHFPAPSSWAETLEAINVLATSDHEYKTLVVDTLNWIEPFLWSFICKRDGKRDIEAYGYSKGYTVANTEWTVFLAALERLQRLKSMHVVLLDHAHVQNYKNPEAEDYGRFTLKTNKVAAGQLREWCDVVLFGAYETQIVEMNDRAKAFGGSVRIVHTERTAAHDAKNRFGLPPTIPLDWSEFYALVQKGGVATDTLTKQIAQAIEQLPESERAAARKWLDDNKTNSHALRTGLNKLRARGFARTE